MIMNHAKDRTAVQSRVNSRFFQISEIHLLSQPPGIRFWFLAEKNLLSPDEELSQERCPLGYLPSGSVQQVISVAPGANRLAYGTSTSDGSPITIALIRVHMPLPISSDN